jgi:glutathione synthase/RimK-type ligase-like ATP-grasp enzyme
MNEFETIMKEICNELGIKLDIISNGWIYVLEKDGIKKFTTMSSFDNNTHALGNIFDDKYGTYSLLQSIDVPVIEHHIVYDKNNSNDFAKGCNNVTIVHEYFNEHNHNIVLKANHGYGGRQVFHITKENEIDNSLNELLTHSYSVSMCPFYNIKNEYRLVVLDNNVELCYKKIKPVIIGDGKSTIKELLFKFNKHFFSNLDDSYNKVLKKDEVYEYNWQFNLSKGATISLDIDDIKDKLFSVVKKITDKIHLGFVTVDIVELDDGRVMVMEINSGVGLKHFREITLNGREISKNIYKKAVKKLFDLE